MPAKHIWSRLRRILLAGLFIPLSLAQAALPCLGDRSARTEHSVLLIPRIEATAMYRAWAPLLERLGRETGMCFQLRIARSFPEFEREVLAGQPDFAFLNPYHEVMAHREAGYIPLIRDDQSGLAGILVVRKDGPIRGVSDLNGKPVAFPSPNAYVASLVLRAWLDGQGIRFKPVYVGSHNNVYRAVALDEYPAGGGANTTLSSEPETLRGELRVLHTTPYFMPHPFAAHPRVPAATRAAIVAAFARIAADPSGRALLSDIQIPRPVAADYARDYLPLEKLGLERYVEQR